MFCCLCLFLLAIVVYRVVVFVFSCDCFSFLHSGFRLVLGSGVVKYSLGVRLFIQHFEVKKGPST